MWCSCRGFGLFLAFWFLSVLSWDLGRCLWMWQRTRPVCAFFVGKYVMLAHGSECSGE